MQSFIFGKSTPWTYEELQRKRAIADKLVEANSTTPRNVGEGLASIGRALAFRNIDKRAGRRDAELKGEYEAQRQRVLSSLLGGGASAQPASFATAAMPSAQPDVSPGAAVADDTMAALGKPSGHDHAVHAGQSHGDWLKYSNAGATRNDPLNPKLIDAMSFVGDMGITMDVVSGGQEPAGTPGGKRTGSTRHDHGQSADVDFYKDGRKLDWNNQNDLPILQEIVRNAKARGVTGIGAGDDYMGPGRFHVGFGAPAVWGAGGSSANAPAWLVEAYNGAPAGNASQPMAAPLGQGNLAEIAGLLANPYASAADKAMLEVVLNQQMQAMDPMAQIELQKAQIELAQMQNPQSEIPKTLQERKALAAEAGLQPGTPEYQGYIATGELSVPGGGTEYGLTPILGRDKDGKPVVLQIGKDGTSVQTQMPDGVTPDLGLAPMVKAEGAAIGKAAGEANVAADSLESKMGGLDEVVQRLNTLADEATYTVAGQGVDTVRKQFGLEPRPAAVARAEYIAMVDNQVLPLLRDTFGAAFTVKEGETLRATLGDPNKSPAEKKAVLNAFIEQKRRDLGALQQQAGNGALVQPEAGATGGPQPGMTEDGYQFKGGDPADPTNWVKVQ